MQIIVVAMGEPKHIKRYCGRLAPNLTCLTGEQMGEAAYKAFGLREGTMREMASGDVLKAGFRAVMKGHLGGQPVGNVKMLPGTFIVDPQGQIAYAYYSQHAGDHPEISALKDVLQQLKE